MNECNCAPGQAEIGQAGPDCPVHFEQSTWRSTPSATGGEPTRWVDLIERALWALKWREYATDRDLAINIVRRFEELLGPEGGLDALAEAASPLPDAGLRQALERIEIRAHGQSLSGLRLRPEAALSAIRDEAEQALAGLAVGSADE